MLLSMNDKYHHCASVAEAYGCYWLAYYNGAECTDDQRVVVEQWSVDFQMIKRHELEGKTGNPVLLPLRGRLFLLYSEFMDKDENGQYAPEVSFRPVDRWKYCDNHLLEIDPSVSGCLGSPELFTWAHGLLGRCHALEDGKLSDAHLLVPLYREKDPLCVLGRLELRKGKEGKLRSPRFLLVDSFGEVPREIAAVSKWTMGSLGVGAVIQPTLYRKGLELHAFCRNVARKAGDDCRAWHAMKLNGSWSSIRESVIPNHNNSLCIIDYYGDPLMVYSTKRDRSDLWLENMITRKRLDLRIPALFGRSSYGYPNIMIDSQQAVHVVHTNHGHIAWHRFEQEYILQSLGADPAIPDSFRYKVQAKYGQKMGEE